MSDEVDQDEVAWARATLVGRRLSSAAEVQAYRILAAVDSRAYALKLARALLRHSRDGRQDRLGLLREAAAAARSVELSEPGSAELLIDILDSYQFALYRAGRRSDGFRVRVEMGGIARQADGVARARGLDAWALGLAEDGRHGEAADICVEAVAAARPIFATAPSGLVWYIVTWAAQAHAAGRSEEARAVFAELVDHERDDHAHGHAQERVLLHVLMHFAWMLDTDGRRGDAGAVEQEALELLYGLVQAGGERRSWSGYQTTLWTTLLAASIASVERDAGGLPLPAFGWPITAWSPDLRDVYCSGITGLEESARTETSLPEVARIRRLLAVRTAVRDEWRAGTAWAQRPRPAFDDSVTVARRLYETGDPTGRAALAQALIDRAGLATAAARYTDAMTDLNEATDLRQRHPPDLPS